MKKGSQSFPFLIDVRSNYLQEHLQFLIAA